MANSFPSLPQSWSALTWQQLYDCWQAKLRYRGNPDAARAAALLSLCGVSVKRNSSVSFSSVTGEATYTLRSTDCRLWTVTPRQLAHFAKVALPWFPFPYGDRGETEEVDDKGKVVKPRREAVNGYVSVFRDAMILPETEVTVDGIVFSLPQVACNNLTWQQYRSLQPLVAQLFREGVTETQAIDLHAKFLAHILVPAMKEVSGKDSFTPRIAFRYSAERAEQSVSFWRGRMKDEEPLFHICFQAFHTAVLYYERAYPLLFTDSGKSREFRDALQGEVGTVNSVMKYQGYSDPQQVYDANLPIILDALNTMAKEAKEIEQMNAKIKKK